MLYTYHPEALAANLYGMRSAAGMSLKELAQHGRRRTCDPVGHGELLLPPALPQSVHHLRHCRLFRRVAGLALRQSPDRKNPRTGGNR